MQPVGGGILHESEEGLFVFGQTIDRFGIFCRVLLLKACQFGQRGLFIWGTHDFVEMRFGAGLETLWQLVQDVGDLVHPAALFGCFREDLAQGGPKTKGTVGNGQFGCRQPPLLEACTELAEVSRSRVDQDSVDSR